MTHSSSGAPQRVLLVSARPTVARERDLRAALALDGELEAHVPDLPLPDPRRFDAIILDGRQPGLGAAEVDALARFVEAGGSLLAIGAAPADPADPLAGLLGAHAAEPRPSGEVVGRNAAPSSELLRRIGPEFPLVDAFAPLRPLNGAQVLLEVTWALRDEPAALEQTPGGGRVVVSALGASADALRTPALRTLMRRALRRRNGAVAERALGVGIVGYGPYGGMGYHHSRAATATDGLRPVAACDRNRERLAAAAADFPDLRLYADADALAADPEVDVVIVATPPATHADLVLAMLRAGKHVVCEKPLCLTVAEADDLLATARENDLLLTVHQNRRWDGDFLAIRRALEAGLLGELFNVETFVGGWDHPCRYWHSDQGVSGGAIYDWGSHYLDWTLLLLPGDPLTVTASAHKRVWHDVTNHDQVRVRLAWADGREAEFLHSDVAAIRRPKFYLQGTAGTLAGHYRPLVQERIQPGLGYVREEAHHAEAPVDLTLARYESGYGITETRLPPVPAPPYAFHRNLADHLSLGEPLAVAPESVRRVIAVLEAAERSLEQGGAAVRLDTLLGDSDSIH